MNIGLNCYNINANYGGGINTFTLGLFEGLAKVGKDHKFLIFAKKSNAKMFEPFSKYRNFEIIILDDVKKYKFLFRGLALVTGSKVIYNSVCNLIYNYVTRAEDAKSDVIYTSTTFLFPYNFRKPTVVSTHDIQQVHFPQFFSKFELLNRKIHHLLSAEKSSYIQVSSNYIKEDLLEHFKFLKEDKFVFIPQGVNIELFSGNKDTDYLSDKYGIPDEYLFYPAQLWPHKNHLTVLKALKILKEEHNLIIPLVLTGNKSKTSDEIFAYIGNNDLRNVDYLGLVPTEDLIAIYKRAKFLIYSSLHESSGLPLMEAAAAGTPIIASNIPPIVELGENLDINFFNTLDEKELAALLLKIWNDKELISRQREHNLKNINLYSWENSAKKYLDFFTSKWGNK
jgi:glycosyltransferase involved in cell wall biosynthesis